MIVRAQFFRARAEPEPGVFELEPSPSLGSFNGIEPRAYTIEPRACSRAFKMTKEIFLLQNKCQNSVPNYVYFNAYEYSCTIPEYSDILAAIERKIGLKSILRVKITRVFRGSLGP